MSEKNKHMTLEDRIEIEKGLGQGLTFREIASKIGKDQTTVSKEVKRHAFTYENGFTKTCECCPQLLKAPYVCNGCDKRNRITCKYARRKYESKRAQKEYQTVLVESRQGIPLNKEAFYENERILSAAVKSGQHIYHAIQANHLPIAQSTVYRHIEKGYYSISKLDLPRAVKFKERKSKGIEFVPKGIRVGRSYEDYLAFSELHPSINCVEMDTVIGRNGGKAIMTFQFVNVDFMFGLLLDKKTAVEVRNKITALKQTLCENGFSFGQVFPLLLTDNGGEFSDVFAFEHNTDGEKEASVFYCNPNAPYQKPHVENNHTLFREIVPKGRSFDDFTQDTVNLIFSHVNAVMRPQFNGKSAYDMFTFTYSTALADAFGISYIDPQKVIQNPSLLQH